MQKHKNICNLRLPLLRGWYPVLLSLLAVVPLVAADEYWLFAGQSNMSPKSQPRAAFSALPAGVKRQVLAAQHDGRPISFWLSKPGGQAQLQRAFEQLGDNSLDVFVWQQGESNQSLWFLYEAELLELIKRIRAQANNPNLQIIINQLGPRRQKAGLMTSTKLGKTKHNKTTPVFDSYWNMAFMREVQRRVAVADPNIDIVATIDLTVKDGIHFDGSSQKIIGQRVALVASKQPGGPIPVGVQRDPNDSKTLLVRFERVAGELRLVDGWQQNAALSKSPPTALPADLSQWPVTADMHPNLLLPPAELRYPTQGIVRDYHTIAFTFADEIHSGDLFHWGFDVGANPEGDMTVQPSLTGITDDTEYYCRRRGFIAGFFAIARVLAIELIAGDSTAPIFDQL